MNHIGYKLIRVGNILQILLFGLIINSCFSSNSVTQENEQIPGKVQSTWVETFGTITESEKMDDGTYAYILEYNVVGGNAKNMDGELIQGILKQYIFNIKKQAILGQKIRLHYNVEEPIFYELLDKIQF